MKFTILIFLNIGLVFGTLICIQDSTRKFDGDSEFYNIENCNNEEIFYTVHKTPDARIKVLRAKKNKIEILANRDLASCPEVEDIDLSENLIVDISRGDFTETRKIKRLNLSKNRISELGYQIFELLQQLEFVDLSYNQIKELGRSTFKGLHQLHKIDLSNNKINRIELNAFQCLSRLKDLDLKENNCIERNPSLLHGNDGGINDFLITNSRCTPYRLK
jgi:Leucine-rich repeat (LRR) protein